MKTLLNLQKMLFVTPYAVESFHPRIRRFLFQINWLDVHGTDSQLTLFPLANYNYVLRNLTTDIKVADVSDSIQNQLIDAMLDARILSLYEKVNNLRTSEEYGLIRGKMFVEAAELCFIYKRFVAGFIVKMQN